MKIKKTLVSALCVISILLGAFTAYAAGTSFTDVPSGKWYTEHINYAVKNGIFNGTSATTFSPETNMTRAQFVQVFANISNVDTTNKNVKTSFTDVPSGKWYTAAVKWAAENGVVNGMGDGTFAPEKPVTREQMCVMLVNYVEKFQKETLQSTVNTQTFKDNGKIASWSKDSVYKCAKAGLVNGVGNNMFDPQGTTTRAQGATFFSNFHKYVNASVPADNSWFAKKGFEITPLTSDLCTNDDPEHICYSLELSGCEKGVYEKELSDGNKSVEFYFPMSCFRQGLIFSIAFDRNTGVVLKYNGMEFREYEIDGQKVSIAWGGNGASGGWYTESIICPTDYDDVVFAVVDSDKINAEVMWDFDSFHTVDEIIDFETAEKYYFFAYNNK